MQCSNLNFVFLLISWVELLFAIVCDGNPTNSSCPEGYTVPCIDTVFVLDVSKSIKRPDLKATKEFVIDIVRLMNISAKCSRVGMILFANKASINFTLNKYLEPVSLQNAINRIMKEPDGDAGTNIPAALNLLRNAGGRCGTLGLSYSKMHIVIFITDGSTHLPGIDQSEARQLTMRAGNKLHDAMIYDKIYAVGIEKTVTTLHYIANPSSLVFSIPEFNQSLFAKIRTSISTELCASKIISSDSCNDHPLSIIIICGAAVIGALIMFICIAAIVIIVPRKRKKRCTKKHYTNDNGSNLNTGAIIGGVVGGIALMTTIGLCIFIAQKKRVNRKKLLHADETIAPNKTVNVYNSSYDATRNELTDHLYSTIKVNSNIPMYATPTVSCTKTSKNVYDYVQSDELVEETAFQLPYTAISNVDKDNVQIDATINRKHSTNTAYFNRARSSDEDEDKDDITDVNSTQESCQSSFPPITHTAEPTDEGIVYGVVNQPKCNDLDFDKIIDQSSQSLNFNSAKLVNEGEYGVVNQPKCDDSDIDQAFIPNMSYLPSLPPISNSAKLTDESEYGIINQPKCNDLDIDSNVDQPLSAKYGVINQPKCDDPI